MTLWCLQIIKISFFKFCNLNPTRVKDKWHPSRELNQELPVPGPAHYVPSQPLNKERPSLRDAREGDNTDTGPHAYRRVFSV